jgi:hypothetical protein
MVYGAQGFKSGTNCITGRRENESTAERFMPYINARPPAVGSGGQERRTRRMNIQRRSL